MTRWYYSKNPRNVPVDPMVTDVVQKIGKQRPTYGTRRMAAQDYAFFAPFKKYLPPLVRSRSWKLKKQIIQGVKGDFFFSYTGDKVVPDI